MGLMGIVLIIIGAVVLVLSYTLPMKEKEKKAEPMPKVDEELIKELIEKEIKDEKNRINDVLDETITYSMEKTERAMERLTNEKMMAVNEYSDQVLEAINKNHQEVIFLYDMLNDKHENLVSTVSEASKKAQEIKQTVQDAEITVKEAVVTETEKKEEKPAGKKADSEETEEKGQADLRNPDKTETSKEGSEKTEAETKTEFVPISPEVVRVVDGMIVEETETAFGSTPGERAGDGMAPDAAASSEGTEDAESRHNNNEIILRLHKLGKSQTAIARELGLGVGEVKLVIDLFEKS